MARLTNDAIEYEMPKPEFIWSGPVRKPEAAVISTGNPV
jgi:hypothetical protein